MPDLTHPALLLTFEGIDGCGKSTQASMLVEHLESEGYRTLFVREPGGTELGERVRAVLLDPELEVDPVAELMLFSAARAQLAAERILPALEEGYIVVCDRFYDSTTAYQGGGRQLADATHIRNLNRLVTHGRVPDRTYLFEIPLEVALQRRAGRHPLPDDSDRMERSGNRFFDRVIDAYRKIAEAEPDRFRVLDGTETPDDLHRVVWADVTAQFRTHK